VTVSTTSIGGLMASAAGDGAAVIGAVEDEAPFA
jgi:hypothetical protein